MNAFPVAGALAVRASIEGGSDYRAAPATVLIGAAIDPSDRFARAWDDLAAQASEANAFSERWFVLPGIAALPPAPGTRFVTIWSGERLDGIFALEPARRYARLPVRHVHNWMHYHCFLGTPLIRKGEEQRVWRAVIDTIDSSRWAGSLLHFAGLVEDGPVFAGLIAAARAIGRPCDIVHRASRAMLASDLTPDAYAEKTIRKKKRKEYNRLANRLREEGVVAFRTLDDAGELPAWCDAFLALEASGWKGEAGSSLGSEPHTTRFFREIAAGAFAAGKLEMLRLELDGKPLAMLVNFLVAPGAFSFKIAFDEDYARFSPGVMVQLENLRILNRADIAWMDSCAVEDHPMINSLWGERRSIVRVTLPRAGIAGAIAFRICRGLERASEARRTRTLESTPPEPETQP